jgi:hypothetical protein
MKVMAEFVLTAKARCKLPKLNTSEDDDSPLDTCVMSKKK